MLGADYPSLPPDVRDEFSAFKTASLRSVQTGSGIGLRDGPDRIRAVMGRPTWQGRSKFDRKVRVWTYHHRIHTGKHKVEYVALFRFRRKNITCIELRRDMLGEA